MAKTENLDVGVIIERREVDHKWLDHEWVAIAVVPGAPAIDDWTELEAGEGWIRYHACMRTLALHRKETEAYVHNLESRKPAVYVVLREHDTPGEPTPLLVALVTVSPYDAQDYMDSGEETVCAVALPEPVAHGCKTSSASTIAKCRSASVSAIR